VLSIAITTNGEVVISGSQDGTIRLWSLETGDQLTLPIRSHAERVQALTLSPDNMQLASGSKSVLLIWDFHQMQKLVWPQNYMQRAHNIDSGVCLMDSDGRFQYYSMGGDGWVRGEQKELLFWIPPDFRIGFCSPACKSIVGARRTLIDLRNFVHGKAWQACRAPCPIIRRVSSTDVDLRSVSAVSARWVDPAVPIVHTT